MNRQPVESSSLKSIGHDGDVLEVEFHSGKVYRYTQFSAEDFAALNGAESIGKHFSAMVRGKYEHERVDEDGKGGEE